MMSSKDLHIALLLMIKKNPLGKCLFMCPSVFVTRKLSRGEIHWEQLYWKEIQIWLMQLWGFCLFLGFAKSMCPHLVAMCGLGWSKGRRGLPSPGCGGPQWCHPHLRMSTILLLCGGHLTLESWISRLCDLVLSQQTRMIMASGLKSFLERKIFLAYTRIIHSSFERIQKMKHRQTRKWQHRRFYFPWGDLSIS